MHQPMYGKPYIESNVTIKGQRLKVVEKFLYIGSTFSKSIVMDNKATKIKVYRAVVLTTLLYGCETWTTYQRRKETKPLSHDQSEEDSRHHMAKTHL